MNNKLSKVFALLLAVSMLFTHFVILPISAEPEEQSVEAPAAAADPIPQCTECLNEERGEHGDPGKENPKWLTFVEATCTDYAYDEYLCDNCGGWYPVVRYDCPPRNHEGIEDVAFIEEADATCEQDGSKATFRPCPICGKCFDEDGNVFVIEGEDELVTIAETEGTAQTVYAEREDFVIPAIGHAYSATETLLPNCVNGGYTTYVCANCNDTYYDDYTEIDPSNHEDPVMTGSQSLICGEQDAKEFWYCNSCKSEWEVITEAYAPEHLTHQYEVSVLDEADCLANETWLYTCIVCGCEKIVENIGVPLGHDFSEWVEAADASCVEDGVVGHYKCLRCGKFFDADHNVFVIDDTNGELTVIAEEELDNQTLATEDDFVIECPGQHEWDDGVETIAPTCSAEGEMTYTCTVCGATDTAAIDIDPDAHLEYNSIARIDATCTEDGWTEEVRCAYCGKLFASPKPIDALGHTFEENEGWEETAWNPYEAATCLDGGKDGMLGNYYCERCGKYFDKDLNEIEDPIIPATHTWYWDGTRIDPTCEEDGYDIHMCTVCGATERFNLVPAAGHKPADEVQEFVVEANCLEGGSYDAVIYCSVCDKELSREYVEVDALGHDLVYHDAKEATCTEAGWDAYETCTRCDYSTKVEIEALDHEYVWIDEVPATCTENGTIGYFRCDRCGAIFDENFEEIEETDLVVEALDHDWNVEAEIENATDGVCENGGSYDSVIYCGRCGIELDRETIELEAPGHTWGDEYYDNVVEATFDAAGSRDVCRKCEVCGTVDVITAGEVIPILNEGIVFRYEATGINDSEKAVNSGYINLYVYMDVESDIARLYGVDFALSFDEHLTLLDVNYETSLNANGCIFAVSENTNLALANELKMVKLAQNMGFAGETEKVFEAGRYLFAILTFKVDKDFYASDVAFAYVADSGVAVRDESLGYANELFVDFDGTTAFINVTMLGDDNGDHIINTIDVLAYTKWVAQAVEEGDYNTIFDMNKDGYIDGDDFDLLLNAVVSNNEYLDI